MVGLRAFLSAWADEEWLFGQLLVYRVGFYGPDLEENIALASLAQDELGHAGLLADLFLPDQKARERHFLGRPAEEFSACRLVQVDLAEDWAAFVLRNYLYEEAEAVRLDWFGRAASGMPDLVGLMRREEAEHLAHWRHWVRLLAGDGEGRRRLIAAAGGVAELVGDVFYLPEGGRPQAFDGAELRTAWAARVRAFFREAGLGPELDPLVGRLGRPPEAAGKHPDFFRVVETMQSVYRSEPEAVTWG